MRPFAAGIISIRFAHYAIGIRGRRDPMLRGTKVLD
jgi:hypothetical protein